MITRAVGLFALGSAFSIRALADEKVTFNEHIRPIFADNCFACHGKDATYDWLASKFMDSSSSRCVPTTVSMPSTR